MCLRPSLGVGWVQAVRIGNLVFAGVDIETTGLDDGCGICQIGVYINDRMGYLRDIKVPEGVIIEEHALAVNGFSQYRLAHGPTHGEVDLDLYRSLDEQADVRDGCLIAIGWNVASFDMQFIKRWLPLTFKKFAHRSIDLNAVCFTIDPYNWEAIKKAVKASAEREILDRTGIKPNEHNAGYDAMAGYQAWQHLQDICQRGNG